jgi:hypothetical protein
MPRGCPFQAWSVGEALRLSLLWLAVAFVFATEFYLSERGGPLKIPWTVAASSALRDWCPWILLSPIAVILAGKFRFGREIWRRSLAVHFAACILLTIAYQGLLALAIPAPYFVSVGGMVGMTSTTGLTPPGLPGVGAGAAMTPPIHPPRHGGTMVTVTSDAPAVSLSPSSNAERSASLSVGFGPLPPGAGSNTPFVTRADGVSSLVRQKPDVATGFQRLASDRKWSFRLGPGWKSNAR